MHQLPAARGWSEGVVALGILLPSDHPGSAPVQAKRVFFLAPALGHQGTRWGGRVADAGRGNLVAAATIPSQAWYPMQPLHETGVVKVAGLGLPLHQDQLGKVAAEEGVPLHLYTPLDPPLAPQFLSPHLPLHSSPMCLGLLTV